MRQLSHLSRVALVIGVQKYDAASCPNLGRVHDDVDAISKMLETQGGFVSVTSCLNPTQRELIKALSKFEGVIKQYDKDGGCVALLYYSGHGMMDKSNHYLLPTDWEELESISTSLVHFACQLEGEKGVLSHLAGAKAAVALFDCCRTLAPQDQARGGPVESKGGWEGSVATPGNIGHHLLLCYACSPGASAYEGHDHGHFTEAILEFLCTHRTVCDAISTINRQVFDKTSQRPHVQGSDLSPFYELRLGLRDTCAAASVEAPPSAEMSRPFVESLAQSHDLQQRLHKDLDEVEAFQASRSLLTRGTRQQKAAVASAIPTFVRLLDSHSASAQVVALQGIADLAGGAAELKDAIVEADAIPRLVLLLRNAKKPLRASAARALANLADGTPAHVPSIVSEDTIPLFVQLLRDGDDILKAAAARGVVNLAAWTLDHQAVNALKDAIPALIELLGSKEINAQTQAARGLAKLSAMRDHDIVSAIEAAGAIPRLVEPLASMDFVVQREAAQALAGLTSALAWHYGLSMVTARDLPPLVRLLDISDEATKNETVAAVVHLADVEPMGAIPLLVQLLDSTDADVQFRAASEILRLSSKDAVHRGALINGNAISSLMRLLQSEDADAQHCSVRAIALLSAEGVPYFSRPHCIAPLVRFLESEHKDVQQHAAQAVANMAVEGKSAIGSEGAIPPLVRLLEGKDEHLQLHASRAIAYLTAGDAKHRAIIVSEGAVHPLVRLLGSNHKDVQQYAAESIANLAAGVVKHGALIVLEGAIHPLLVLLESKHEDVQLHASRAIAYLASGDAEHAAVIVSEGAVPPLVVLLESKYKDVQLLTAWSIGNLAAGSHKHAAAILSAGAIPPLVRLLESRFKDVQFRSAQATGWLAAGNDEHVLAIVSACAIPPLVRLLESKFKDVKEMATEALESFPADITFVVDGDPGDLRRELERKLHEFAIDPSQIHHLICPMCGIKPIRGAVFTCKDCPRPPGFGLCGSCMDKTESEPGKRLIMQHTADHRMVLHVTAVHFVKAAKELMMPEDKMMRLLEQAVLGYARPITAAASPSSSSLAHNCQVPGSLDDATAASTSLPPSPAAKKMRLS